MCRPVGFAAILFTVVLCIGFVFQDVQDSVAAAAGTRSWIDAPLNGSNLPLAAVEVVSHSTNPSGISKVELSVDGEVVGTADNSDTSQSLLVARMEWKPSAPGNYTLMVRAQDTSGSWGSYAKSVVTIAGVAKTITPTVTPKVVITVTPTATATGVPPSPTATPTPKQEEPPAGGQEVVRPIDTPVIQREPTIQEINPTRQVPPVQQVPTVLPLATVTPTPTVFVVRPRVETIVPEESTATPTATPTATMRAQEGPVIIPLQKATATPTSGTGPRIMVPGGQNNR